MSEPSRQPLSASAIRQKLDIHLLAVLSDRRTTDEASAGIARLARDDQDFVLRWTQVIARSNSEMAYQFVLHVSRAFALMDAAGVESWVIATLDIYDREGLFPGSNAFRKVDQYAENRIHAEHAASFHEAAGILAKFIAGICGRNLKLLCDHHHWTDTEAIFLPDAVNEFSAKPANFQLMKAMGAYLAMQNRYGTFRIDQASGVPIVCETLKKYVDQDRALQLFAALEEIRILHRLKTDMPGLARQLLQLGAADGCSGELSGDLPHLQALFRSGADVMTTLDAVDQLYPLDLDIGVPSFFRGKIDLEAVRLTAAARVQEEKKKFRSDLAQLCESIANTGTAGGDRQNCCRNMRAEVANSDSSEGLDSQELWLSIDGRDVALSDDMAQTASSVIQDFGKIPEDYLIPAADRGRHNQAAVEPEPTEDSVSDRELVYFYDEWDYRRRHYRKNWCTLIEKESALADVSIVEDIIVKHRHLVGEIRKSFQALRDANRSLRRQKNGDDIDIDALIEGFAEMKEGNELTDRLFIQPRRLERDLAVVFMIDISGSTKGWINDAERESLVLLCEALHILGDRYAIYGFSGMTRKRCEIYPVKTFGESYSDAVKSRIAGLKPKDYTRMGAAIRHLSKRLTGMEARTRMLITISDGKPDDYDGYRGEYGVEDTRRALMEAKYAGIHPFCITIDSHAHDYLPRMYGHVNYTVIDNIRRLPLQVSDIYRKTST